MRNLENPPARQAAQAGRAALKFVLLIGILSFFADFTYEGARSELGPYLAMLGASATAVGVITGFGELLGYGLRLVSGRAADVSGQFWPIAIFGYVIQMASVPALALTSNWYWAAVLIMLERIGKAIRNPPRDVMLSYAGKRVGGYGWVFGLHEAMDQFGALFGPLLVAGVLAWKGSYHLAFAVLIFPAFLNLAVLLVARMVYPHPQALEEGDPSSKGPTKVPPVFWIYLIGASLAGFGFADYPVIAYHFSKDHIASGTWIAVFYSVAMAVSGTGSLLFGRLFDRYGFKVLIILTAFGAAFAPLVFWGSFWAALAGAAIWGLGMGVQESIIPAAVSPMIPPMKRASAFGSFTAAYGVAWFGGSALIGFLYDHSSMLTVIFCVAAEFSAVPFFVWASYGRSPVEGRS